MHRVLLVAASYIPFDFGKTASFLFRSYNLVSLSWVDTVIFLGVPRDSRDSGCTKRHGMTRGSPTKSQKNISVAEIQLNVLSLLVVQQCPQHHTCQAFFLPLGLCAAHFEAYCGWLHPRGPPSIWLHLYSLVTIEASFWGSPTLLYQTPPREWQSCTNLPKGAE